MHLIHLTYQTSHLTSLDETCSEHLLTQLGKITKHNPCYLLNTGTEKWNDSMVVEWV